MAVFELGANHRNEINTLTRIVRPDIVCITNIGYAHIGYFGSLNAIAEAKFEIVNGLHGKNSMVLLNGDDPLLVRKNREKGHAAVFFGMSARCAVRAENCSVSASGHTGFSVKGTRYQLSIPGRHFVYCALPAIFLGRQMGIADEEIAQVLRNIEPDSMRGRIVSRAGIRFIVDCYNANPSSMRAGLALLADVTEKKRCAVIGDMLELGTHAKRLHANLGKQIAETGIKKLLAVGTLAAVTAQSAKQHGMKAAGIVTVPDSFAAVEEAHRMFEPGDTVLLKGSRGIKLETVFESYPE
jgi:UDP-N-acetylmuramoyl-tripeptide--D-alanyl-D-alanine ligase